MRKIFSILLFLLPVAAHAELYTYTDKEGVVHFTNVPPHGLRSEPQAENTFDWPDALGNVRKLHRVDFEGYDTVIRQAASYYSLPPALIKAVIAAESGFEPKAVSPKGAQGLMQLIPETARLMLVHDSFDPVANIYGGARYLRVLANRFGGDLRHTVAGYNAGPEAVARAGGVPPYTETQLYVKRVLALYQHYLN